MDAIPIQKEEYVAFIQQNGFTNISIQKEKRILIPDDILKNYLNAAELKNFK